MNLKLLVGLEQVYLRFLKVELSGIELLQINNYIETDFHLTEHITLTLVLSVWTLS